jgi:hypothetical protein
MTRNQSQLNRRNFMASAAAATAVTLSAPAVLTASRTNSRQIFGQGDFEYKVEHDWAKLPDEFSWQTTHNVAVDREQNLYVIHEGHKDKVDHPSIFVFDKDGKYIRSFGKQFQGGGHGIEIREEDGQEFLYIAAYLDLKTIAKLDLTGETVWQKYAPVESGTYQDGEEKPSPGWGRNRFLPTNFAFLDDGDFLLADGYGSFKIHRYDKDGTYKSSFGGVGEGQGTFNTPHGLWVDKRGDKDPELYVTDRAHHTVQILTLDGEHKKTLDGFGLPANIDTFENLMVVPELHARVTILDENNEVLARIGADVERVTGGDSIRTKPDQWLDGKFVHPHDACFDGEGSIFVAEWVSTGRVSKLTRV